MAFYPHHLANATLLLYISVLGTVISTIRAAEVCYGDLGCFTNTESCGAIDVSFPPHQPAVVDTHFLLYTPENSMVPVTINKDLSAEMLTETHLNSSRPTKIIVHGWQISKKNKNKAADPSRTDRLTGLMTWMLDMKDTFLQEGNYNVILVDWTGGSSNPLYMKSAQNTKVAGREIGLLLRSLNTKMALSLGDVHIIGTSLGAHVAGFAGKFLEGKINRITGLDPAGPLYKDTEPHCRLDQKDALYVDIIHTDIDRAGINQNIGDVDFYPNGGHNQPACSSSQRGCSHLMAMTYFTLSIPNECPFTSFPCVTNTGRILGICDPIHGCPTMGEHSSRKLAHGQMCVVVHNKHPYCDRNVEEFPSRVVSERLINDEGEEITERSEYLEEEGSGSADISEVDVYLKNDLDNIRYKRKGNAKNLIVKLAPLRRSSHKKRHQRE